MFGPLRAACATSVAASFGPLGTEAAARVLSAHERAPVVASADDALFQVLTLTMQIFQRAARLT